MDMKKIDNGFEIDGIKFQLKTTDLDYDLTPDEFEVKKALKTIAIAGLTLSKLMIKFVGWSIKEYFRSAVGQVVIPLIFGTIATTLNSKTLQYVSKYYDMSDSTKGIAIFSDFMSDLTNIKDMPEDSSLQVMSKYLLQKGELITEYVVGSHKIRSKTLDEKGNVVDVVDWNVEVEELSEFLAYVRDNGYDTKSEFKLHFVQKNNKIYQYVKSSTGDYLVGMFDNILPQSVSNLLHSVSDEASVGLVRTGMIAYDKTFKNSNLAKTISENIPSYNNTFFNNEFINNNKLSDYLPDIDLDKYTGDKSFQTINEYDTFIANQMKNIFEPKQVKNDNIITPKTQKQTLFSQAKNWATSLLTTQAINTQPPPTMTNGFVSNFFNDVARENQINNNLQSIKALQNDALHFFHHPAKLKTTNNLIKSFKAENDELKKYFNNK
jgi:hypothetical protein